MEDAHKTKKQLISEVLELRQLVTALNATETESRQAGAALRENEALFHNLMEYVPGVSVQGYTADGIVRHWNKASEEIYGYTAKEAIGRNLGDLIIPPEVKPQFKQGLELGAKCTESGEFMPPGELMLLHKNGSLVPVYSIHTIVCQHSTPPLMFCIDVDLSERKRTEEALRKAHNELERRVEERTAELAKAVTSLRKEIEERKQAEEALRKSHTEIEQLKDRLQAESDYLREEIQLITHSHREIVGESEALNKVLLQLEQVAPTESTALITGETGTGKELVARAIHNLSKRKDRVMVKVDCASLPSALVESELFGREKGAYTGALTSQVGRFKVADGSSIFLDEIGELSPELQAKLLRVIQEGEFERLGSPKTIRVNVRVIAATNRDLSAEVRKGNFREDLYYRLNVFHVEVPPLRERPDDIPLLVWTFVNEFAEKMGKKIQTVPKRTMESLQRYHWPGNVRELRNVIEHAVIISAGDKLKVKLPQDPQGVTSKILTLNDAERQHITKVLDSTNRRIKGPHGAAELLGLKPSTLYTKMNKLGIPTSRNKDAIPT